MSINSDNNIKYDARFKKPQYIPDELYKAIQERYGCTPNEYYAYYYDGEDISPDADGNTPDLTGRALEHFDDKDAQLQSVTKQVEAIYDDTDALNEVKAFMIEQLRDEFVEKVRKLNGMYTSEDYEDLTEAKYKSQLRDLLGNFCSGVKRIIGTGTVEISGTGHNESTYSIAQGSNFLTNLFNSCEFQPSENAEDALPFSVQACYQAAGINSIPAQSSTGTAYTTTAYTEDEWINSLIPAYLNNQVSKAFNLTRVNQLNTNRPEYSEWDIYSYEEILAMEATGAQVPNDLLEWAKSMQEAATSNMPTEGNSNDTLATTKESSLKDIEKKTQKLNEQTKKSQEKIESNYEDLKLVVDSTQKLKDEKENDLTKSLEEMNNLSKEYKELYKKSEEGELSEPDKKRFQELYKLLNGENGVLSMNIKASSNELEELINSIDDIDTEIDTCIDLGNETIEMANKLAHFERTDETAEDIAADPVNSQALRAVFGDAGTFITEAKSGNIADIATRNANKLIDYSNTLDDTLLSEQYTSLYDFATLTVKSFNDYTKDIEGIEGPEDIEAPQTEEPKETPSDSEEEEGETKELSKAEKFMQEMQGKSLIEIAYALLKQDFIEETKVLKSEIQLDFMGIDSEFKQKASTTRTKAVEKQVKNLQQERKALQDKQKKEPQKFSDKDKKRLEKIDKQLEKAGAKTYDYVKESLEKVNEYNNTLGQGELRGDDAIDFGEITTDISAELLKWSLVISLAQPILALTAMSLSASALGLGGGMIISGKVDNKLHETVEKANNDNIDDISASKNKLQEITEAGKEDKRQEAIANGEEVEDDDKKNGKNEKTVPGMEGVSTDMSASQATKVGAQATTGVQGIITETRQGGSESQQVNSDSKRTTAQVEAELTKTMIEIAKDDKQVNKMAKEAEKIVAEVEKMTAEFEELQAQNDDIAAKQEREANMAPQVQEPEPQVIEVDEDGNPIGGAMPAAQPELTVTSSSSEDDINTLSTNAVRMGAISGKVKTYNGKLSKFNTQIRRIQKKNQVRTRRCQKLALEKRKILIEQQKIEEEKQKRLAKNRGIVGIFRTVFTIVGAVGAILSVIPVTAAVGAVLVAVGTYGALACTVADSAILLSEGYTREALIGLGVGIVTTAISLVTAGAGGKAAEAGIKAATSTFSNAMTITSAASQIVGAGADMGNYINDVQGNQRNKTLSTISQGAAMVSAAASSAKGFEGGISFKDGEGNKTFSSVMGGISQVAGLAGTALTTASQFGMLIKGANGDKNTEFEDILNVIGTGLSAASAITGSIGDYNSNNSAWGNISTIANAVGSTVSSSAQITMMIKEITGDSDMDAVEIMNIIGAGFSAVGAMAGSIDMVKNQDMNGWNKTSAILGSIGSTVVSAAQITMLIKQLGGDDDYDVETIMALVGAGFSLVSAITGTIGSMVGDGNNKNNQNTGNKKSDKPEETKPEETKPAETKPEEQKPAETKPEETKPEETKPEETKPEETKPEETKPEETKPEETPEVKEEDDKKDDENNEDEQNNEGNADEDGENANNNQAAAAAASTTLTTSQKENDSSEATVREINNSVSEVEETARQQQQDAQDEQDRARKAQEEHDKNKETNNKTSEAKAREQEAQEKEQRDYELRQENNNKEIRAQADEIEATNNELAETDAETAESEAPESNDNETTVSETTSPEAQPGFDTPDAPENDNLSIKTLKSEVTNQENDVTLAQGTVTGLEAKGMDLEKQLQEAREKGQDTSAIEKAIAQNKLDLDNAKKDLRSKEEALVNSKKLLAQKRNERIDKINKWMNITTSTLSTGLQVYEMIYALTSSNEMSSEEKSDVKSQLKLSDSEMERLQQARIKYNRARARGVVK